MTTRDSRRMMVAGRGFDQQPESRSGSRFGAPAIVIHPLLAVRRAGAQRSPEARLAEILGLAAAIRLDVRDSAIIRVRAVSPATLFGKGQVERLAALVRAAGAEVVVIDAAVTPIQQKNLEDRLSAKIIDRTGLILEIFGERAVTSEGRLQVELAHLEYQAGRLVRSWTHLERQRGGYGFLGGPGETQIETDRRLLRNRIAHLKKDLDQVRRTRGLHRRRRQKAPYPTIALVGYTNSGKSTLFNRLTGSAVMAKDLLFATLDPTMRQVFLPGKGKVILSDTVGFISDLPTELVAAFRATLEEVTEADLIVHVRDLSSSDSDAQYQDVQQILATLGVLDGEGRVPIVEAWNKADLLPAEIRETLHGREADGKVLMSALTGDGIDRFRAVLAAHLNPPDPLRVLRLHPSDTKRRTWLAANGEIIAEREEGGMLVIDVRLGSTALAQFNAL